MKILIYAAASAVVPLAASAQSLTFGAAIERALANTPTLEAKMLGVQAARSTARSADALPDPKLAVGVDNFPVSGPPAGSFAEDSMTMARVGISQEMPNAAKRHARLGRAQADITAAEADARVEARAVRVGAALAWVDLAFAGKRLAALDAIL